MRRPHRNHGFFGLIAAGLLLLGEPSTAHSQTTYLWGGSTGGAWLTPGNWTVNSVTSTKWPGVYTGGGASNGTINDIAEFGNATTNVGINMNTVGGGVSGGFFDLGAINVSGTGNLQVGNSSTTVNGLLRLNGATLNGIDKTLAWANGANLTIANLPSGTGTQTMGLRLGITDGVFQANTARTLAISSIISEGANPSGFTFIGGSGVLGTSSGGILSLTAANTFTGNISVGGGGRLQTNNAQGLGLGNKLVTVSDGAQFYLQGGTVLPSNIGFSIAGLGYNETAGNLGAIRIETGTVSGNITLAANARIDVFSASSTPGTIAGTISGAFQMEKNGVGILALSGDNSASNSTAIVNTGTLQFNAANSLFGGANSVTVANTFTYSGPTTAPVTPAYATGAILAGGSLTFASLLNSPSISTASTGVYAITASSSTNFDFTALTRVYPTLGIGTTTTATYSGIYTPAGDTYYFGGGSNSTFTISSNLADGTSVRNLSINPGVGIVVLSGASITYTGTTTISPLSTLQFASASDNTLVGGITGAGNFSKSAVGKLTLTGASDYTGTTGFGGGTIALAGGNNRLPAGASPSVSSSTTLDVGSTQQTFTNVSQFSGTTFTVIGTGGKLTLNGSGVTAYQVGSATASSTTTASFSALSEFTFDRATAAFSITGINGTTTTAGASAVMSLAGTNTITAASVVVGAFTNAGTSTSLAANSGTLNLGTTNTINTALIQVGDLGRSTGTLGFQTATNPTLTIRGTAGGSTRADFVVGSQNGQGIGGNGTVNLTANVTGTSVLDALIGTLTIGRNNRATIGTVASNANGSFTMGGGTLDATTIILGQDTASSGSSTASSVLATFTQSGASSIVKVQTLTLGDKNSTSTSFPMTSVYNLNAGTLNAQTIQSGSSVVATGSTITRTINWNDGTVKNYDAATDLAVAVGGPVWVLANTGTHTFNIDANRSATVGSALTGTGGTLAKAGAGTLILNAVNTYTGATTVSAGTLAGTGTIAGNTTVNAGGTIRGDSNIGTGNLNLANTTITSGGTIATYLDSGTNSKLALGSNTLNIDTTAGPINIRLLNDSSLALNTQYTLTLATGTFQHNAQGVGSLPFAPSDFNVISDTGAYAFTGANLSVSGNNLQLQFTTAAVPEPAAVFGLTSLGLGFAGLLRRRSSRR